MLAQIDSWKRSAEAEAAISSTRALEQLAFDTLLTGVVDAFDLKQESPQVIESYDTQSRFNRDRIDANGKTIGITWTMEFQWANYYCSPAACVNAAVVL